MSTDQPEFVRRIAVIGAGPSGIYCADALTRDNDACIAVDVMERLPAPFGLVRYGVAPDHLSIRSVRDTLEKVLQRPGVRFLGGIEVGGDVSVAELHEYYDAIVFTYGASTDRRLGISGEDLPGSIAATDFVAWYCGHPDARIEAIDAALRGVRSAVVIGVGNVAVDVARVLAKTSAELAHTDMPHHVLDELSGSTVTDIHILGRRGPAQASFTTKELRELGELADAAVVVHADDLILDPASEAACAQNKVLARNLEVLQEWSQRAPVERRRRIHMRFYARPVELLGESHVTGIVVERTRVDGTGAAVGTGQLATIPAELVIRSVGYRGLSLSGVLFDAERGVIPHDDGRITRDGTIVPGEYVAGWIKRGPTGIIGTNKKDAAHTVSSLLHDLDELPMAAKRGSDLATVLTERGGHVVTLQGWSAIDSAEIELGRAHGRNRTTIHSREALLALTRDQARQTD
jgi:NADPH-dependent glutamate synthase beta subunit-like oxidoreductase